MKRTLFILLALAICSCTGKETQGDEEAIRKVVLDFQLDFNDGQFNKAESYATTDWDHINPGGGIDIGREAVLRTVRGVHQSFLKGVTMTTDSMRIKFIKPDVAIVTAYHTIDTYITPDSVRHVNEQQIKSYVVVKEDGKWLLTMDHNTSIRR